MSLINSLTNFVTGDFLDFLGDGFISDAVNGALFGAITTAVGGGDIGEGAAWGAAGNVVSNSGIFGQWSNEIGGGIAGYGLDTAMGGDGILGAISGSFMERLNEAGNTGTTAKKSGDSANEQADKDNLFGGGSEAGGKGSDEVGILERYGLQKADGDGTLLGKAVVGSAMAWGQSEEQKDIDERQAKIIEKSREHSKELDEEYEQRNISAFRGRNSPFVIRNG